MDFVSTQWIYAVMGIMQALIAVVLWFVVYYKTGHRNGWLIIPFLPIVGMLVTPVILGWFYTVFVSEPRAFDTMPLVMSMSIFLISIIPLVILVVRLLNGRVRLTQAYVADVFGE